MTALSLKEIGKIAADRIEGTGVVGEIFSIHSSAINIKTIDKQLLTIIKEPVPIAPTSIKVNLLNSKAFTEFRIDKGDKVERKEHFLTINYS